MHAPHKWLSQHRTLCFWIRTFWVSRQNMRKRFKQATNLPPFLLIPVFPFFSGFLCRSSPAFYTSSYGPNHLIVSWMWHWHSPLIVSSTPFHHMSHFNEDECNVSSLLSITDLSFPSPISSGGQNISFCLHFNVSYSNRVCHTNHHLPLDCNTSMQDLSPYEYSADSWWNNHECKTSQ